MKKILSCILIAATLILNTAPVIASGQTALDNKVPEKVVEQSQKPV